MAIAGVLCPVLVGRDEQLADLEDSLLAACGGEGQMVVLLGEAGIGKTRLTNELERRALDRGATVMQGGCPEADLALPYLPFIEAVGNYLATVDLPALRARLGPAAQDLGPLFPQLGSRAGQPEAGGDVQEGRLRLFEAMLELLRQAAGTRGLLVAMEDLQWADASTRELLSYVSRRLSPSRIMVLAACRKEDLHRKHPLLPLLEGWRRAGTVKFVELEPLPAEGVGGMVQAIVDRPVEPGFRDFLFQRSEGNPFVVEEFLKVVLDRGFRPAAGWEQKVMKDLTLPPTVRDAILLRVERLGEEPAEILRTAAVLGATFSYPALVSVSGRPSGEIQSALRLVVQQQLIHEETGGRYRFRHALTHEAVYDDLISPRRAELHGRAADVLAADPHAAPVEVAHHLLAAGRWQQAVPLCLQAAQEAERRGGYREAAELYERVLPHLPDDVALGQVLCRLGEAHLLVENPARGQRHLEEGVRVLEKSGERRAAAHYRIQLGICCHQRSQPQRARTEWERARQVLEPEGPSEDLAYACIHLASLQGLQWETEPALALAEHAVAVADAAGAIAPRTLAYSAIGMMLTRLGRVDEGLIYLDRAYTEAIAHGLRWIAGNALMNGVAARTEHFRAREALPLVERLGALGVSHRLQAARAEGLVDRALGDPLKTLRSEERAATLARERGAALFVRRSERGMAAAYAALGRFEEALRVLPQRSSEPERDDTLTQARAAIRTLLDAGDLSGAIRETQAVIESTDWGPLPKKRWLYDAAVEALVQAGRTDDAEGLVRQSRSPGGNGDVDPYQARMEGRLALAQGEAAAAAQRLTVALECFSRAGYREEESRTRRVLSEAMLRQGDRAGAETELRQVLAYAAAHGAVSEGECARQQLAALGVMVDAAPPVGQPVPDDLHQPSERLVTVMFVDVRGYSALTARHAPAQMVEMVAAFQRSARREIERRHGLLDKFAGDAAMATFNVSGARLDHSLHALQAALAIRDRAASGDFPVGIGIAVGPAVVGALTEGANVSVVGEATNLAARLQGEAAAGEVLLSEEAFRRVSSWLQERRISPRKEERTFKGFAQPVVFHRLLAPAAHGREGGSTDAQ